MTTRPPAGDSTLDDGPPFGLTDRYTLESWRTGEVVVHRIPESVYRMPAGAAFHKLFANALGNLNPVEQVLYLAFDAEGWRVTRLPLNKSDPLDRVKKTVLGFTKVNPAAFHGRGVPDFILWDARTERYRFVEVKHSEWTISPSQAEWARKHDVDFHVARLARTGLDDAGVVEENRCLRPGAGDGARSVPVRDGRAAEASPRKET